jgi:hypothetical protein
MSFFDAKLTVETANERQNVLATIMADTRYGESFPAKADFLVIETPAGNTSDVYIGGQWVSAADKSGRRLDNTGSVHYYTGVSLADIWFDGTTAGDELIVSIIAGGGREVVT